MKKELKTVILILLAAAVIYFLKFSPYSRFFFTPDGRAEFFGALNSYLNSLGFWAPFMFVIIFASALMFFVPASIFTSISALIFGKWAGLGLSLLGAYLGAAVSFYISRYLLRDLAVKVLQKAGFKALDEKAAEHGFSIIMYLRLMFVAFTYLNYAVGVSKIKFRDYFWGTVIGVIPGLVVITFLVASLKDLGLKYAEHQSISRTLTADIWRPDVIFPVALFIFSFFIPAIIKKFKDKFAITPSIEEETGAEK